VVIDEIERCREPKRSQMLKKLELTEFEFLDETDEVSHISHDFTTYDLFFLARFS
jgi:hypothetical protein